MLYFLDERFVFRLDKTSGAKEYVISSDVHGIIDYKGSVVALQLDGTVHVLHTQNEERGESWIEIGYQTMDIEANDTELAILKSTGDVWLFTSEPEDAVVFVPRMKEYVRTPIVHYTPTVSDRRIIFWPTPFSDISALDKNDQGGIVMVDGDGASSMLYTLAEELMHNEL